MPLTSIVANASVIGVILLAITCHEAAHAWAAARCGDDTAQKLGRVSLNPLRHIDLIGTILLPAALYLLHAPFLIGWAKPVPVKFAGLHHWRRDMALVAAAGPGANFVLAALSGLAITATTRLGGAPWLADALQTAIVLNLGLGILNLIPIPPLDGSKVLAALVSERWARKIAGVTPRRRGLKWILHGKTRA